MAVFAKLFGDQNKREAQKLQPLVDSINKLEHTFESFTLEQLKQKTDEFRKRVNKKEGLDVILPEAFASVREAAKRSIKMRHFDVQLMGGMVLHHGKIAEMKTGEGKTLVATLPAYLNTLQGKCVHIITVNDYLAKRDTQWMGPVYHTLGISVGCIQHEQAFIFDPTFQTEKQEMQNLRPVSRKEAYASDVLYGTNNEFGFDYLRDNMAPTLEYMVQRELVFAIVDEVDSILIDEARTPLIISAPAEESTEQYYRFAKLVERLQEGQDYNVDEKMRASTLTDQGITRMEEFLGMKNIYEAGGIETLHHIEQALRAKALFKRDRDYVVKDGEVIIVDEFTGRLMQGRRYSDGLHQAIEAKENVSIKQESQTLATITFQNYFRLYGKLAGMTGTAATEAEEFAKIYNLEVIVVPTHKPMIRQDDPDRVYKTEEGKFQAIVREIKMRHELGQPVLVGTISIERNEVLSALLTQQGIPHNVLNAKQHEREAATIAQAGKLGGVTIATNIAGRGVDIILGGNPQDPAEQQKVKELGGLHVLGTERHEARRIDNQLRGRSGRQGDQGSSQFYVSLEDDLMRIFASDRMKTLMTRLGIPDDMPIENKLVSRSIEAAQKKVEGHNFDIRKHLVEYDDVMNKHRTVVYKRRREILEISAGQRKDATIRQIILGHINDEIDHIVSFHTSADNAATWNIDEIYESVDTIFPIDLKQRIAMEKIREKAGDKTSDMHARDALLKYFTQLAQLSYDQLEKSIGDANRIRQIEHALYLRTIDTLWIEHLTIMDHLRQGIGLRGYGQRDPLVEYKKEAYRLFNELMSNIQKQIAYSIFKITLAQTSIQTPLARQGVTLIAPEKTATNVSSPLQTQQPTPKGTSQTIAGNLKTSEGKKIGRNDPCPCGSGKKYKKCGLLNTDEHRQRITQLK